MAVTIDIFNPQVSKVAKGLRGKVLMIYGGNNLGKTYQAVRMSKPYVFACESGLNAINGVAYNKISDWADFKKATRQFTHKSTIDKAKEMYDTIIIDEVYASSQYCQDFVCAAEQCTSLGQRPASGVNLYQAYEKEYWREINKLVGAGYTVVFIAHQSEKDDFITPKGDKRCINPIIDNCDFVIYLESNGVDEDGKVINSSAYLAQTDRFFARSRFTHCDPYIENFTAENLEKTIIEAIERQEAAEGIESVDFDTQQQQNVTDKKTYDELMADLQAVGERIAEANQFDELTRIVEAQLGVGRKASDLKKGQEQIIEALIMELEDFADTL